MANGTYTRRANLKSDQGRVPSRRVSRRGVLGMFGATALAMFVAASPAGALPKLGADRPSVHLVDGWDRDVDLAAFQRPVLLVYEDKDSSNENSALKDELADFQKSADYRKRIAHLIVADTSAYDYFPAKGIAKGELRKWSDKLGIVVYSDFSASVREKLGLEKGKSNVVLYGAHGEVLFAVAGTASPAQRTALIEKMKSLL